MKKLIAYLLAALMLLGCVPAMAELDAKEWLSPDQYYRNQLTEEFLMAWGCDVVNALSYPEQISASQRDRRMQALAPMIKRDNPKIFWIDWIDTYARLRFETGSVETFAPLPVPEGMTLSAYQVIFDSLLDAAVAQISADLPANADTRTKARAIHDWLCRNNTYNEVDSVGSKKNSDPVSFKYQMAHSAYSAIVPGDEFEPTCDGYATGFKALCDEMGVPCICVSGTVQGGSHQWNYVKDDDGKWYLVDVATDDAYSTDTHIETYVFMAKAARAQEVQYVPDPYLGSGVNPSNGYTEGFAFTFPELAK